MVVELRRQLHVLDHGELGRALQLILICDRVLHPNRSNLHQHVLAQLIYLLDTVFLDASDQSIVSGLLLYDLHVVELAFILPFVLVFDKVLQRSLLFGELGNLLLLLLDLRVVLCFQSLNVSIYSK